MGETLTLQQRMKLLNLDQVGTRQRPPAPPAKKLGLAAPPALPRSNSTGDNVAQHGEDHTSPIGNLPASALPEPPVQPPRKQYPPPLLPRRDSSQAVAPSLPPRGSRRPSELSIVRKSSQDSIASTVSTTSVGTTLSTRTSGTTASRTPSFDGRSTASYVIKAPEFDPTSLPKLPPKRQTQQPQQRPPLPTSSSSTSLRSVHDQPPPPLPSRRQSAVPSLPPRSLPARPTSMHVQPVALEQVTAATESRPPPRRIDPRSFGLNKLIEQPQCASLPVPVQPDPSIPSQISPPPIPFSSKPKPSPPGPAVRAAVQVSSPNPNGVCLKCRDFSEPDTHASRFPRQSIPSTDAAWLAHQLTDPFPSATDKARAIFAWLHFNIVYDCEAFFSGNLKASTPASTIASGRAVCEGFAGLFTAFALHAGLESVVIGGHGKGFGHKALQPGEPIPPFGANHAWSAVRIDNGEWKLVEPCWGAGHLGPDKKYRQVMTSEWFTKDNDAFGLEHFPQDRSMFFRSDGQQMTWEEYVIGPSGPGEPVKTFNGLVEEHGLAATSFAPAKQHIRVRGVPPKSRIHFQFSKICEHWDGERTGVGKPYVYVLAVGGKDGRKRTHVPFETNGTHWWLDVAAEDLGCQGQTLDLYSVTSLDGKEGRGLTVEYVRTWIGRRSMGFGGVAQWQLV